MSLRALPRAPLDVLRMLNNLIVVRSVENLMRRLFGENWQARNEPQALVNADQ